MTNRCDAHYGTGEGGVAICGRPANHPPVSEDGIGHNPHPTLADQFGGGPYATKWEGKRGWFRMCCFNGLSAEQQHRVVNVGNLPIGYTPDGDCPNPATVGIETEPDSQGGPRFYCWDCAVEYVTAMRERWR